MGTIVVGVVLSIFAIIVTILIINRRVVVGPNEVHIVQTRKRTTVYGGDSSNSNTYYNWPSWLPVLGLQKAVFPISVFSRKLNEYEAYDKGRLPFVLDLAAFFRIEDPLVASKRVATFPELEVQLDVILQGAARSILASKDIEEIMQGRAEFGVAFTKEVEEQLSSWGVTTVKNIELMDIRDSRDSKVISNIMMKKKSFIEMESRIEVANNNKVATNAEIEAKRQIELTNQTTTQEIGIRAAEVEKEIGLVKQTAVQQVKEKEKVTAEKEMEILRVKQLRSAEIERDIQIVNAELDKQKLVIDATAKLEAASREAEGVKIQAEARATSIRTEGQAKADAEEKIQLAPVNAQITLAKEIGGNAGYQQYLVTVREIEQRQAVGLKQAEALKAADVKFIINASNPNEGINKVGEILSSKGGLGLGAALEAFKSTEAGRELVEKILPLSE